MANETMIRVDGVAMPCPSTFNWSLQDVSAGESGRTDDTVMHKNRVGQKRKIELAWVFTNKADTAFILQAFNPEYFDVTYYDPMAGRTETRTFYAGDRVAPVQYWFTSTERYERVSFDIIER